MMQQELKQSSRVLEFLHGCAHPEVAPHLRRFGFTRTAWEEGWDLLRAAGDARFALVEGRLPSEDFDVVDAVDTWENRWFPIVEATLRHRFPKLHERVFLNLGQKHGLELLVTVPILLERIDSLTRSARGREALAILEERGFTREVREQASGILQRLTDRKPARTADPALEQQAAAASERLWSWYLEWSQIARTVLTSRRALSALGFKPRGRPPKDRPREEDSDE